MNARLACLFALLLFGCTSAEEKAARQRERATAARQLFDQTVKQFHLPSADAQGAERDRLLGEAAKGYETLLRRYPEQSAPGAMALRSLGNVRATQGKLDEAVKLYTRVGDRYGTEDWEVLQAWKSAADLLGEAGRAAEARAFDQRILARFSGADQPAVVKVIVRAVEQRHAAGGSGRPMTR
jgi:tetratricopeptide (TPR) repeat protein